MNYVNKNYDDWDKYIQQGDIVELVQEYASHVWHKHTIDILYKNINHLRKETKWLKQC